MIESAMASCMLAASDLGNLLYIIAILIFAVLGQLAKKWQEHRQSQQPKKPDEEIHDAELFDDEVREAQPWPGRARPAAPAPRPAPARSAPPPIAAPVRPPMPRPFVRGIPQAVPTLQTGRPQPRPQPRLAPARAETTTRLSLEHGRDTWRLPSQRLEAPGGVRVASRVEGLKQPIPSVKTASGAAGGPSRRDEPGLVRPPQPKPLIARGDFATAGNLRRALLMAEVLGPPLALRGPVSPLGPAGITGA